MNSDSYVSVSQKLFISSLLHGKIISQGRCQGFLQWFCEAARQEMKDGGWPLEIQPQRQEAHRAIVSSGLVFSALCSITKAKAQINSIWWLAETATQWVQPTFKYTQHWSRHMGYSTVFPRCNVTALCCATPVMYCHISLPIVSETSDECVTSSACLVWLHCQVQICVKWDSVNLCSRNVSVLHIYSNMHITEHVLLTKSITGYVTGEWRYRVKWGLSVWMTTPSLTLIWDTGLRSQTVRNVWCPSWPDTDWQSPRQVSVWECIYVCCWPENHLLPYESCCNPGGEIMTWLFLPYVLLLGLLADTRMNGSSQRFWIFSPPFNRQW